MLSTRFRAKILVISCGLLSAAVIHAQQHTTTDMSDLAKQILGNAGADNPYSGEAAHLRPNVPHDMIEDIKKNIADYTGGRVDESDLEDMAKYPDGIYLFVSSSMGLGAIEEAITLSNRKPVSLIFRGLMEGYDFVEWIQDVEALVTAMDLKAPPNILLDPTLFNTFGINRVPAMLILEDTVEISRVYGTYNPDYITRRREAGRTGLLTDAGKTVEIAEVDLLVQMQQKMANYDMEGAKTRARDQYWHNAAFNELPKATESKTRTLDPTVVFEEDIISPDGSVIAEAGQRVNPLDHMPMTTDLYIFDATDEDQVNFILSKQKEDGGSAMFITTAFDRDGSWEGIADLEDNTLDARVYLLTQDVIDRFNVRVTPTIVRAVGNFLQISEYNVDAEPKS